MAVDLFSRWRMIRDITSAKRTGTLILQMGRNYLQWAIQDGKLSFLSSTNPEFYLTRFLLTQKEEVKRDDLLFAESQINETRSLCSVILQLKLLPPEILKKLIREHWSSVSNLLLQSTTRLFWSERVSVPKLHFIDLSFPFSELILSLERASIEIRSASEFAQELLATYKIHDLGALEPALERTEKRMLHYLKRAASLQEMLLDAELDRITCYRTLFLLWLSGRLYCLPKTNTAVAVKTETLWEKLHSIPAEWILPFVVGILLGLFLAPHPADPVPKAPAARQESAGDIPEKPAWSTDNIPGE
jgi:hypothetical protein